MVRELDEAFSRAMGDMGEPGPVYVEIPTDVLRTHVPPNLVLEDWMRAKPKRRTPPEPGAVEEAVEAIWSARRPLVISGRGARGAEDELVRFLDASGALYLDTQESRGLVPADHPSVVGAVRAAAMSEADCVLVIGRKLDYQVGYGSPAVFPNARFIRLSDTAGELIDNRRGDPELLQARRWRFRPWWRRPATGLPTATRPGRRDCARKHAERMAKGPAGDKLGADGKAPAAFSRPSPRWPIQITSPSPMAAIC